MASVWPERASNGKNRLISELLRGRDSAIQLQALLSGASGDGKALLADEMLGKILRSFSESISVMNSCESAEVSDDVVSGDSGESKKRPGSKEGRGSYKRRRGSQSWTTTASTMADGHAWRKYGQKEILNSKFPRCYFRCTHKHDQGCKATKQVQKMEDDSNMYRITYLGQHTCREIMRAPQMIPDADPWESDVPGTYRESKHQIRDQDIRPNNPFSCVKDEHKEDSGSDLTDCISGFDQGLLDLPGFDQGLLDLPGFGSSAKPVTMSSGAGNDFSLWSFSDDGFRSFPDMDLFSRYGNFEGDFQFAGSKLL